MRVFSIVMLIAFVALMAAAQTKEERQKHIKDAVANFVKCFTGNERAKIAAMVTYPYRMDYPVPDIKNIAEFLRRYDEVFDNNLIKQVRNTSMGHGWEEVGYHGIMFDNGAIWLGYDGNFSGVLYKTQKEKLLRHLLVERERKTLYPSLRNYKAPAIILETKQYLIRIDKLDNDKYRYASWTKPKRMSQKPDLVLKGEIATDNECYTFKNKTYSYICDIIKIGKEGDPPAELIVMEGDLELLHAPAEIIGVSYAHEDLDLIDGFIK